ncbi:unnamed protein product [uncultured bacterium]|nr:unnamed protein product [uncultured bacterium]
MECCGKERTSRFCPDCGNALQSGGLWELLSHMRVVIRTQSRSAERNARKSQCSGINDPSFYARRADSQRKAADKWTAWADELAKLLEDR